MTNCPMGIDQMMARRLQLNAWHFPRETPLLRHATAGPEAARQAPGADVRRRARTGLAATGVRERRVADQCDVETTIGGNAGGARYTMGMNGAARRRFAAAHGVGRAVRLHLALQLGRGTCVVAGVRRQRRASRTTRARRVE